MVPSGWSVPSTRAGCVGVVSIAMRVGRLGAGIVTRPGV
jgi:hypothetical protein